MCNITTTIGEIEITVWERIAVRMYPDRIISTTNGCFQTEYIVEFESYVLKEKIWRGVNFCLSAQNVPAHQHGDKCKFPQIFLDIYSFYSCQRIMPTFIQLVDTHRCSWWTVIGSSSGLLYFSFIRIFVSGTLQSLEKTNNFGFQPGSTQTGIYIHRRKLESWNFGYK